MATKPVETPAADTPPPAPAAEPANFNDAFAAAAASDEPGFDSVPPPPPAPASEPPPLEVPGGDAPPPAPAPEAAPAAETPPVGDPPASPEAVQPPAPAPAAPAAAPTAEDIVKQLAERLNAPPPPPAPAAQQQEEAPPLYSPEEVTVLTDYEKNWPDVAQAEALKRRGEYHDLMKYVFTEVHSFLQPHLAQIAAMGNTIHEGELRQALPDYSADEEPAVAAWVETQPSYLQAGMKQVMQSGTSEEVVDLIGRYRAATGTAPAPAPTPAPAGGEPAPAIPAVPAKTELSNLAKQAAESLAPVSSDRTQVPAGEDPGDFNSAFARYASEAASPS